MNLGFVCTSCHMIPPHPLSHIAPPTYGGSVHYSLWSDIAVATSRHLTIHGDTQSKVLIITLTRGIVRNHLRTESEEKIMIMTA